MFLSLFLSKNKQKLTTLFEKCETVVVFEVMWNCFDYEPVSHSKDARILFNSYQGYMFLILSDTDVLPALVKLCHMNIVGFDILW